MELDIEKSDFNKTIAPWLGKTSKMMNMYISDVFQKNKCTLTKQQWVVLKILFENPDGIIQNKLAFITDRNKATLTRLINGLEKHNLVARIQCKEDSRKNIVHITKAGNQLFLKTKPLMLDSIHKIQHGISENEMNNFIETMTKIQNNIKNQSI